MKMPGMNGIDTVVMLREGGAQVPIIALTAFAYDDDRALALNVGCNDFLTKPVSPLELRRMVSKWIGNKFWKYYSIEDASNDKGSKAPTLFIS